MNVQLIDSLVEVILNLPSEDRELFESKLLAKRKIQVEAPNKNLSSINKAKQFLEWISHFPKSKISLPIEASNRENIYDDRGR